MNEQEILRLAIGAQTTGGPTAMVELLIPRRPLSRYITQMQIYPKRGPWGRIIALTPEGTTVQFNTHRLIAFLAPIQPTDKTSRVKNSRAGKVRVHAFLTAAHAARIREISTITNLPLSALIDSALGEYIQRYA